MKSKSLRLASLLPVVLAMTVASSRAAEIAPSRGLRDLPGLATPAGLVALARGEIRDEQAALHQQLTDLRAGKPKAIIELSFTGARLAGAGSGPVTAARIVYHFATLSQTARNERLDSALPRALEQAPDRGVRRVVHAALHGAVTGNWNVGQAIAGDLGGQAIDLAPAALNSTQDAARKIASSLETSR